MALNWHGTNINLSLFFSLIVEFGMLLFKIRYIKTHNRGHTSCTELETLKTPEQTQRRPASLDIDFVYSR